MPERVQILRVVVASPADVKAERTLVPRVVEDLNAGIAADRGLRLEVLRWETDSYPGFHPEGPQGLIDSILRIEDSDIVIGIFWKRFGTPTKDGATGTEHEIRRSYEAWAKGGRRPQVMVYFNQKPSAPQSPEEADQWGRVLRFRNDFPAEGLWWPYKSTTEFERLLRVHLTNFIRDKYQIGVHRAEAETLTGAPLDLRSGLAFSEISEGVIISDARKTHDSMWSTLDLNFTGQHERAEAPSKTDPSALRHLYRASANALSGELTQPFATVIRKEALVRLTGAAGMFSQRSDEYRHDAPVSFASAHTQVAGSASSKAWTTLATATVEKLNLLDVVTADRIVARLSIDLPINESDSPQISFLGTTFDNLRISGTAVYLRLQTGMFAPDRTSLQESEPRVSALVTNISSSLPYAGNSIVLPGLGTLFLGELLIERDSYQLRMIRLAASSGYVGTVTVLTCEASVGL